MAEKRTLTEQDAEELVALFGDIIDNNNLSKWQEIQDKYGDYTFDEIAKVVEDYKNRY